MATTCEEAESSLLCWFQVWQCKQMYEHTAGLEQGGRLWWVWCPVRGGVIKACYFGVLGEQWVTKQVYNCSRITFCGIVLSPFICCSNLESCSFTLKWLAAAFVPLPGFLCVCVCRFYLCRHLLSQFSVCIYLTHLLTSSSLSLFLMRCKLRGQGRDKRNEELNRHLTKWDVCASELHFKETSIKHLWQTFVELWHSCINCPFSCYSCILSLSDEHTNVHDNFKIYFYSSVHNMA